MPRKKMYEVALVGIEVSLGEKPAFVLPVPKLRRGTLVEIKFDTAEQVYDFVTGLLVQANTVWGDGFDEYLELRARNSK